MGGSKDFPHKQCPYPTAVPRYDARRAAVVVGTAEYAVGAGDSYALYSGGGLETGPGDTDRTDSGHDVHHRPDLPGIGEAIPEQGRN